MPSALSLHIILQNPPPGVDFGLQKGQGRAYETVQKQHSTGRDLHFRCSVSVKEAGNADPVYTGPFVQGRPGEQFLYIGIGTHAGQINTPWSRRLKIPLRGISTEMIRQLAGDPKQVLQTSVPGTGKDGGPNCATVKPFEGWTTITTTSPIEANM